MAEEKEEVKTEEVKPDILKLEREKVCIVGCAPCKKYTPWGDDSFEFWGVNNLYLQLGKDVWERKWKWFEIHPIQKTEDGKHLRRWDGDFRGTPVDKYLEGLAQLPCPVVMQQKWAAVPNSIAYPINEILQKFGNYFTNSISYEIALAIAMGAKEIHIYGVDMAVDSEYHVQRPSCEYFIGLACGAGIKVHIPSESDLCKTLFLYAYQEREKSDWKKKSDMMKKNIEHQVRESENLINQHRDRMQQGIGAQKALVELVKIWS